MGQATLPSTMIHIFVMAECFFLNGISKAGQVYIGCSLALENETKTALEVENKEQSLLGEIQYSSFSITSNEGILTTKTWFCSTPGEYIHYCFGLQILNQELQRPRLGLSLVCYFMGSALFRHRGAIRVCNISPSS